MAVRAPQLHRSLRCFCLGAFRVLGEEDADLPFAFEGHRAQGRPTLYEYRPLVREFVLARAELLARRQDAQLAVQDVRAESAAAAFGDDPFRSVLLPLLLKVADDCGRFDWDDAVFERAYAELEATLFSGRRAYAALAPLVGLSIGTEIPLGAEVRVRRAATGELARHWPEAQGLLPDDFGREVDRLCVLELGRELRAGEDRPDAPAELADAVTAVRLATAGSVAAGPVLFERLDWRPLAVRPVLPLAAAQPLGEATRLDPFRGRIAADLLERLARADDDEALAEALDRWELSLFQTGAAAEEGRRAALAALLGGADGFWAAAMRASVLLGTRVVEPDAEAVRRALVETLLHDDRPRLIAALDETMLGLRPRVARESASARAAS